MAVNFSSVKEAFWARVNQLSPGECWPWLGSCCNRGYGRFNFNSQRYFAHVLSFQLHHGGVPTGHVIRHRCDNPPCVNPNHLESGTQADNVRDTVMRGRTVRGEAHWHASLTDSDVQAIRSATGLLQTDLGMLYGIGQAAVSKIQLGKTWRHVPA